MVAQNLPSTPPSARDPLPTDSRYECLVKIASGGMASVYVGRLRGAVGFWRLVAVKRAHAHLVADDDLRRLLVDEARLASKIHHPNVVAVLDVEELEEELFLVMDYVEGAALSELAAIAARTRSPMPPGVAVRIALDACAGLHAAHELCDDDGVPMRLVHRDVSPQNVLVGVDGMARIADFGIAKCTQSGTGASNTGTLKGKVAYMSPEYIEGAPIDARSDVFALGVVVWEAITGQRLFRGATELETMRRVVETEAPRLSSVARWVGPALDGVLAGALEKSPAKRFPSAQALGEALEAAASKAGLLASRAEVGAHVKSLVGKELDARRVQVRERVRASELSPGAPPVLDEEDPAIHVTFTDMTRTALRRSRPEGPPASDDSLASAPSEPAGAAPSQARRSEGAGAPATSRRTAGTLAAAALAGAIAAGLLGLVSGRRSEAPASATTARPGRIEPADTPAAPSAASPATAAPEPAETAQASSSAAPAAPRRSPAAPSRGTKHRSVLGY